MDGACEARLPKLQQYLPFPQRAKDYYVSYPDEKARIDQLITVISSAGTQYDCFSCEVVFVGFFQFHPKNFVAFTDYGIFTIFMVKNKEDIRHKEIKCLDNCRKSPPIFI